MQSGPRLNAILQKTRFVDTLCPVVVCGVVWRGVLCCGVVWSGVAWRAVVWCGVASKTLSKTFDQLQEDLLVGGVNGGGASGFPTRQGPCRRPTCW